MYDFKGYDNFTQDFDESVKLYAIKNKVIPRQLDVKLLEKILMSKKLVEN